MAEPCASTANCKAASRSPPPHPTAGASNPQGRRVTLCFTPQNWDSPRPITVAAAPDAADGGSTDRTVANADAPDYRALRFLDEVRLLTA